MFIRLKTDDSTDVNVNVDQLITFAPATSSDATSSDANAKNTAAGMGTVLRFVGGGVLLVQDSTRSIRSYIKKAGDKQSTTTDHIEDI